MGLGQNPTIKDGKLSIQGNEWLQPIANGYPALEKEYLRLEPAKNRTNKAKIEAIASIRTQWLGRRDSNPRYTESKSDALPLGYSPILLATLNYC